jgi:ATP:ADP antiporter, AAA family
MNQGTRNEIWGLVLSELKSTSTTPTIWDQLHQLISRVIHIKRDEVAGVVLSFGYFLAVLCAYYIIRPVRDEVGVTVGKDNLQQLFVIVFLVMLAAVPLFGWVVSTFPKRKIVPVVYGFFITHLIVFWALFQAGIHGVVISSCFFVWGSVFNLFVISLFWILLSDLYRTEQAKRLYGFIAAGGSVGAVTGPLITQSLVKILGPNTLLLVSAAFLVLAAILALALRRLFHDTEGHENSEKPIGDGLLAGARKVWETPYLFRIALVVLLANLVSTFFYLEQTRIVGDATMDRAARVQLFARLDLTVSVLTILAQLFVTGRVMTQWGVTAAAVALPIWATIGLVALWLSPTLGIIAGVMAIERTIAFSLTSPALKVLFTGVEPEAKYKAQNFIDTVVYRAGDAGSGYLFRGLADGLGIKGAAVALVALPAAMAWSWLSVVVARTAEAKAASVKSAHAGDHNT